MKGFETWTRRADALKREVYALYFACRDPRVPWYAKVLAAVIVGIWLLLAAAAICYFSSS